MAEANSHRRRPRLGIVFNGLSATLRSFISVDVATAGEAGRSAFHCYRKTFLTGGESVFTPGDAHPVFDFGGVRFGINICYDTRFPRAAAAVAAGGAQVLLVPAQNMMRRDKAFWWQERHNQIRAQRVHETGMWLVSADVTGQRDSTRIGLGPTCIINPAGHVVARVPTGTTGMAIAEINQP